MRSLGLAHTFLLVSLLACGCAPGGEPPAHVILISVDTLRADHVGLLGSTRNTTPNIDRFFGNTTIFESAASPAPCTLPAVPQFLSGSFVVGREHPALAETLASHGWITAAIASQHQFRPGSQRNKNLFPVAAAVRRGFSSFDLQGESEVDHHGLSQRDAHEVTERALRWIDENAAAPHFFLWLHYFDPHDPYEPPQPYRVFGRERAELRGGDRRLLLQRSQGTGRSWQRAGSIFEREEVAHFVDLYDGEILYTDAEIGQVLDALDAHGLTQRSVVVFLSDHGEWLGEDGRWDHCQTMREAEIHIPLFFRVKGGQLAGLRRVATPASTLDVVPTLLGLLEIEPPQATLSGRDLRREWPGRMVLSSWRRHGAVRSAGWKLLFSDQPSALYRIGDDPQETRNRLGEGLPEESALAEAMRRFSTSTPGLSEQNEQLYGRLRALGYID